MYEAWIFKNYTQGLSFSALAQKNLQFFNFLVFWVENNRFKVPCALKMDFTNFGRVFVYTYSSTKIIEGKRKACECIFDVITDTL